ncbi:MAG: hypothetical protein WCK49_08230 [Myxococcaceae bacterium]
MKKTLVLLLVFTAFTAFSAEFMGEAKNRTSAIIGKILKHPFLLKLGNGTLSEKIFQTYAVQDNIYSWKYAHPLSLLAFKTQNYAEREFFLRGAYGSTQEWNGAFPEDVQPCPSCEAYSLFELECAKKSFGKGLASIAPCYVVYAHVAEWLKKNTVPSNPYQEWIDSYAKPGFQNHTLVLEGFLNRVAENVTSEEFEEMLDTYFNSTNYELKFWNDVYYEQP